MLIELSELKNKYNIKTENILHIGAHQGQESQSYLDCGATKIHWVEANKNLFENLKSILNGPQHYLSNEVISETDGGEVIFNIANSDQSSSILDLAEHKSLFPDIFYVKREIRKTKTLDTLLEETKFLNKIDFVNIDIQGAELLALKGFTKHLSIVNSIYLEINEKEVYKNCGLLNEIDSFLFNYNFSRKEKKLWNDHPWGDAFYLKNS
jgi:FkbM family methyltransferase